jgi:predicted PolB exonuclease-like 3'-5' exonuclease
MISTFDTEPVLSLPHAATYHSGFSTIVFDIETGPAPLEVIEQHLPEFEAPANYKDPAKIEAYCAEQRERFIHRAALSPLTGRVIAIGAWVDGIYHRHICEDAPDAEESCLRWFWSLVGKGTLLVGFNSNRFDLPFLYRRSWALGISIPSFRLTQSGRLHDRLHVDLMEIWQLGDRQNFISLDAIARYLGIGRKTGEGEFFHKVLRAFPEEAIAYLENDVRLTFELAKRLNVIHPEFEFDASGEGEDY